MPQDTEVSVSELLKVMTHDLRNPLSALVTNLHFMHGCDDDLDRDAREALADSISLCDVLRRLITNLDLVSRAEGDNPMDRCPTSLGEMAEAIVQRNRHQAVAAGLDLVLTTPATQPDLLVVVDRDMFSHAAENLVANAIEHAPTGSCVKVALERRGPEAALLVIDSAAAVPPELRQQAVSTAGQARQTRRGEARYGRGLGLLSADLAARAAGARLELDGQAGESVLRLVAPLG